MLEPSGLEPRPTNPADALSLFRRALASREAALGEEHPDTLVSVNNLAACQMRLGDAAGALPLFERALAARERTLGAEHPDTLVSVNNLATCRVRLGDDAAALALYERAIEAAARVLGPDHALTRQFRESLTQPAPRPWWRRFFGG